MAKVMNKSLLNKILATQTCSCKPHTRVAANLHTHASAGKAISPSSAEAGEVKQETEGLLNNSKMEMKGAEKGDGSFQWWAPHPSTGVWAPEGHVLTSASSSISHSILADTQPWFRDDVHAECRV
eukprot:c21556_g1_i1 orf=428-802(+)